MIESLFFSFFFKTCQVNVDSFECCQIAQSENLCEAEIIDTAFYQAQDSELT